MDHLRSMRAFVAVTQNRSFAMAAERLRVTPSLVSKQIADLERRLGVRLLNRTTRRVEITDIGQRYYESCVEILGDIQIADDNARDLQRNPSGTITLRAMHSIAALHLPALLGRFAEEYPRVQITLVVGDYPREVPKAIDRGLDLTLHLGPIPPSPSSLAVRELAEVVWRPYAAPSYLQGHGPVETPQDLARHNCLVHFEIAPDNRWLLHGPKGPVSVKVAGSLASDSVLILRDAVLAGIGIAMLPDFCITRDIPSGALVRLLPAYKSPKRNLSLLFPSDRRLPQRVRVFIDFMVAWFRNPPWVA